MGVKLGHLEVRAFGIGLSVSGYSSSAVVVGLSSMPGPVLSRVIIELRPDLEACGAGACVPLHHQRAFAVTGFGSPKVNGSPQIWGK